LALHRIESARVSTLDFERPRDFDLEAYEREGRFGFGHGQRVRLSFRIDSYYASSILEETPLSEDQVLKPIDDDTVQVTATVVDSAHLDWWLRGFGDAASHIRKRRIKST
ncbi:MAG TPA: WYL domain-containing protein, partial [Rhodocyclaceae bacterium]|nr:WYL domain-containing protein [Rhodocyclaceae bacterium]